MEEKLAITVFLITLALFALIGVIYHIIDEKQDTYNQIVLSQQEYDSRIIPYRRGDIVDRNGTYLATTEKVYNLILDPKQIMADQENYLEETVNALNQVFAFDSMDLRTQITANPDKAYIRYARQLSFDQKEAFENLEKSTNLANRKSDSKARIKGVWFEDEYRRIYPNNSLACNVVGFATGDGAGGNGGIEQYYNDRLIGTNGREYGYLNDDSNLERVIKSAVNGDTIVSTIDVNIQSVVEKYINEWNADPGANRTACVVMNPKNGEVLAMASDKQFDLNNPRVAGEKYTEEELRVLGTREAVNDYKLKHRATDGAVIQAEDVPMYYTDDEIRSLGLQVAWNQEWRNFCISDTYEPGSPSKIFTVATALEEGVITGNESYMCDGGQEVGGWFIKCVNKYGHGMLTVPESLMQSCNDAMMQIAAATGRSRFCHYMQMYGFGSKTGIDLPGEADTRSLVYNEETMKPSDLATNSFGQNYNCTMIQMAAAYCSVINGGSYYEPHVVKQILNEQGSIVKKVEPNLVRETVSENTANFIKDALFRTVDAGTGKAAAVEGYEVAGKTGTAEKYPRGRGNYLVSFCGFAPAYDPQVLVYVIIDTPHVEDQPHSTYASGVFAKILKEILPYMNIFPAYSPEDDLQTADVLPEQEGIRDLTGANGETEAAPPEEEKVYATEEYIEPDVGEDSGIPANMPVDETTQMILEIETESGGGPGVSGSESAGSQVVIHSEDTWEAEAAKQAQAEEETQEIVID